MRRVSVGVIGLGYVGLPLVVAFAEAGEQVVAVDLDPRKVAAVTAGESYIEDIASERLKAVLSSIDVTSLYQPLARNKRTSHPRVPDRAECNASSPSSLP